MRTYFFKEIDSPKRGCNVRITVYRVKRNQPIYMAHSDHHTKAWRGGRAQAMRIIHIEDGLPWADEHYELDNLIGFAGMYQDRGHPRNAIRLFQC